MGQCVKIVVTNPDDLNLVEEKNQYPKVVI